MTLVTFNGQEFIFDIDKKVKNQDIRNHLKNVNAGKTNTTDATVVSPAEFLLGNYDKPKRKSSKYKLEPKRETKNKKEFDEILELC